MDNPSDKIEDIVSSIVDNSNIASAEVNDIVFDDVLSIDSLKNKLESTINDGDNSSPENSLNPSEMFLPSSPNSLEPVALPDVQVETSVKKYVIHVDPENVNYMEQLTVNERRRVINNILKEQSFLTAEEIKSAKAKKRIAHSLLAVMTFFVALPLFFISITTVTKITIKNYVTSKSHFSKLYRENGKIKAR